MKSAFRRGFTLVELLVVITILAILSSMMLFALSGAQQTAIEMRTRGTIAKLNDIILQKYETYRTRRVPVDLTAVVNYYKTLPTSDGRYINSSTTYVKSLAMARLDTIRDIMRLEMPDGFNDIVDDPLTQWKDPSGGTNPITMPRPALSQIYLNIYNTAYKNNATAVKSTNLQQAMCLFLIVTKGSDDPDVMEQFAPNEIKTDVATGFSYFVDGWGNPIYYLRWAPAYISALQPDPTTSTQHDPFDPMNVDSNTPTYPLYPLIYSPGPDGGFGVTASLNDANGNPFHYGSKKLDTGVNNDPFYNVAPLTIRTSIGFINDPAAAADNITNHDIATR